jgi:hypothetical protein
MSPYGTKYALSPEPTKGRKPPHCRRSASSVSSRCMGAPLRRRLAEIGREGFVDLLAKILGRMSGLLLEEPFAIPTVRTIQRRYPSQRAKPFVDAELRFDMRTAVSANDPVKRQTQWAKAAIDAYAHKKSNLQMQIGVMFPLPRCEAMMSETALRSISQAWCALEPLLDVLSGSVGNAELDQLLK